MVEISVIMGVLNAEDTLDKCILSVLDQSLSSFEFIICDDGSIDSTWEILNRYAAHDSRIILIKNFKNMGLAYSLNRCIGLSRSEYLVRQDADDISLPGRLDLLYRTIVGSDVSVLGSDVELFDGRRVWGRLSWPENPSKIDWMKGSQIIHPTCIMRKSDIVEVGGYDSSALRVEDIDLWYRLLMYGKKIANCNQSCYRFSWGEQDYERKRLIDRWRETKVRAKYFGQLNLPLYRYFYIIKPLIAGVTSNYLLYRWHRWRFRKGVR